VACAETVGRWLTEIVTTAPVDPPDETPAETTTETTTGTSASGDAGGNERRRRQWWVAAIVAGAVLLVLLVCGGIALVGAGVRHAVRSAEDHDRDNQRVRAACVELERRLNRLAPPGSTRDQKSRAAAIRAENAAVRPYQDELDADSDRGWRDRWAGQWRQLVDARGAYADALDRAAAGGEPAFYLPPQTNEGRSVAERLERGPDECAASVRRLAAPDL
jgi:hypothetical protein